MVRKGMCTIIVYMRFYLLLCFIEFFRRTLENLRPYTKHKIAGNIYMEMI